MSIIEETSSIVAGPDSKVGTSHAGVQPTTAPHDGWHYLQLLEVGQLIQSGQVSPVEVTVAQLERIRRLDCSLKSFAVLTEDMALEQARRAEVELCNGIVRSPLHGVPIAIKDIFWTKGIPTAAGMPIHRDFRPTEDATVVKRLRDAGAVLLGKLQLPEGVYAEHRSPEGAPVNPWCEAHWSGASSSGNGVAVAAGLCFGSVGSDTGGSIRLPCAVNGVTGLKPTWSRVSRHGTFELAATLDHVGPMARSAADAGAMLNIIAGADCSDPTASQEPVPDYLNGIDQGIRGLRVGVDLRWLSEKNDRATTEAVGNAISVLLSLGAELHEVEFPDPTDMISDWFGVCAVQTAVAHEETYPTRKDEYGPSLSALLDLGNRLTGVEYQKLLLRRENFRGRVQEVFQHIDVFAIPTTSIAAFTLEMMTNAAVDLDIIAALHRFTCPFTMSGNPTITMPCGFIGDTTPIAFQLVGRHFGEQTLVRAGHAFQLATNWHRRHPEHFP